MPNTDDHKDKMLAAIKILRQMFLESHDKSQITLKGECQTCNKLIAIDIVPTPGGYGILGGVLTELTPERFYCLLCPACHTRLNQANKAENQDRKQ